MFDFWTILLCSAIVFLFILWRKTSRDSKLPPGPPTTPFLGNLTDLKPDGVQQAFREYRLKYGDVFSLILGSKTMIVVNGMEALRDIFVKNADIMSDRANTFITKSLGKHKGIICSSGPLWKEHRSFSLVALREFGFGKHSLESKIIEEVEVLMKLIDEQNGQSFNIKRLISVCISNVMCSINFGKRFDHDDEYFLAMLKKMDQNIGNSNTTFIATFFPFIQYIPGDPFKIKRTTDNIDDVEKHLLKTIDEHEASFDENNPRDYTDMFIKKMRELEGDPNTTFDREQLLKCIGDLFVAGTETTSTAMLWFIALMINYPDIQDRMRQEIYDAVGASRFPSLADKSQLVYTEAVLNEVLRYGCIAPLTLPIGPTRDLPYKGSIIPKESLVVANLHSVLYDPDVFPEPEEFRPTRFLENGKLVNVDKNLAFSIGRRNCLGESLARMEFFLFATTLLQRFRLLPSEEGVLPSIKGKLGLVFAPEQFDFRAVGV